MKLSEVPSTQEHERRYSEQQARIQAKAAELWATFNANQKTAMRFGMFPHEALKQISRDDLHEIIVALMDCASKDGGMRA